MRIKLHLTHAGWHDRGDEGCTCLLGTGGGRDRGDGGCTHVLGTASGTRADTSGRRNAMGVSVRAGAVAIGKERKIRAGEIEITSKRIKKRGCNTRTSQVVTQLSTTLAQARLTTEF